VIREGCFFKVFLENRKKEKDIFFISAAVYKWFFKNGRIGKYTGKNDFP